MTSAYRRTDGRSFLREMDTRQGRVERGVVKTKIPLFDEAPTIDVEEGAMLYLFEGQLRVRIGTTDFTVNLTEIVPPPEA